MPVLDRPNRWFPPRLTTKRLVLRAVDLDDIEGIYAYASNPKVAQFTLWEPHETLGDSRRFVEEYAFSNYRNEIPDPLGIALREEPAKIIGTTGCYWASEHHLTMELGYALAEEHWGRGLAQEAAWASLCFAFSIYRPERIQARCHVDHRRSTRVLEKLGMVHEGRLRSAVRSRNDFWDIDLFAILRPDWQRRVDQQTEGRPFEPAGGEGPRRSS